MSETDKYLQNAENCNDMANAANDEPARARYRRMADAWHALAREQAWLDGQISPTSGAKDGHSTKPV